MGNSLLHLKGVKREWPVYFQIVTQYCSQQLHIVQAPMSGMANVVLMTAKMAIIEKSLWTHCKGD